MRFVVISALLAMTAAVAVMLLPAHRTSTVLLAGVAVVIALVIRGRWSVRSSLFEAVSWRSPDRGDRRVGLSFDGGADPLWTPRILDVLAEQGVSATFFVMREHAREHPELIRRLIAEGHEVGCHAGALPGEVSPAQRTRMRAALTRCREAVRTATESKSATGSAYTPLLYRPPDTRNPSHAGVARSLGMVVVGMARRGNDDVRGMTAARLTERCVERTRPGEILALHDAPPTSRPDDELPTVAALPDILDGLKRRGLDPVPVSALLAVPAYEETRRGWTGRSRGGRSGIAFFASVLKRLGPRAAGAVLLPVAAWFVLASPSGRRASIELRTRLHGEASLLTQWWWAYRHFLAFGRNLLARLAALHDGTTPDATYHFDGPVEEALREPGGVLFVSAHLGDWTAASQRIALRGRRLAVVAFDGAALGAHQVRRDADAAPFFVIDATAPPTSVAMEILAHLRDGDAVAMLGDRTLHDDGVATPFLDGTVRLPAGPWVTAMLADVPAFLFAAVRNAQGELHCYVRGPLRLRPADRSRRRELIADATRQFAAFLETCVRRDPLQWANFYPFWEQE